MVLPLIIGGLLLAGGSYLAGRTGGGGSSPIDALSRNEIPLNLFGSQNIDKSTVSTQISSQDQTSIQKTFSPIINVVSRSPNADLSATSTPSFSQTPSQTLIPTLIPTGAGAVASAPSGSSGGIDLTSIFIIGALGLVGFGIFKGSKKK